MNRITLSYSQMREAAHKYLKPNMFMMMCYGALAMLMGVLIGESFFYIPLLAILEVFAMFTAFEGVDNKKVGLPELFTANNMFATLRYIGFSIIVGTVSTFVSFFTMLMGTLLGLITPIMFVFFVVIAIIITFWALLYLGYRFYLVLPILINEKGTNLMEACGKSWRLMNNNTLNAFGYDLSYIGWVLLGIITLGFGMIYVFPLLSAGSVSYYRAIMNQSLYASIEGVKDAEFTEVEK